VSLLRVAFRNLSRKPSRTALSILAVAIGVFSVIMVKGFVDGILSDMLTNTIQLSTGHVRVIDRDYRMKERLLSLQYPVDGFAGEGYEAMAKAFADLDHVVYTVPRLRFGAKVAGRADTQGVMAIGVDMEAEERLARLSRHLTAGRLLHPDAREAVMGYRTMEKLNLQVGDRFTLVFTTAFGSMKGYSFTVVGALQSGLAYLDDGLVYIPLTIAQDMREMGPAVTEILLMGRHEKRAEAIAAAARKLLAEKGGQDRYEVIPWTTSSTLIENLQLGKVIYYLIYVLFLFLASFVVINTMVMVVNERRREIGLLSAMGLRPGQIVRLFMYEGAIISVIGSVAGVVAGSLAVLILSRTGIVYAGLDAMDPRIFLTPRLYPVFNASVVLFSLFAGIIITVLAVYGSARQAGRLQPTQALRA
jgi:putative ABC transport system permease protein